MKTKPLLGLALVLSGGWFGCSAVAGTPTNSNQWHGFEILPPITNANPSIRVPLMVHVPAKLKIVRASDTLSVEIDKSSLEATNLMVGTNMVTGVESKVYVYPDGQQRPVDGGQGLSGGLDFNLGTRFWHTKPDGIPVPGKKYVVEVELTAFETDIPPQHDWSPQGSKNYKILWQRTLKQTVLDTAAGQTSPVPLYLCYGFVGHDSAHRFLSARIHLNEAIFVGGDDYLELKGQVERHGTNLVADLLGSTGQQSQFYRGDLTLEKPVFAQGGAASGGAGPRNWFLISTNWDCRAILKNVNAVLGLTGAPFNHPAAVSPPPVIPNVPKQIEPATGLPAGNLLVDPTTGLPLPPKQDKQP